MVIVIGSHSSFHLTLENFKSGLNLSHYFNCRRRNFLYIKAETKPSKPLTMQVLGSGEWEELRPSPSALAGEGPPTLELLRVPWLLTVYSEMMLSNSSLSCADVLWV